MIKQIFFWIKCRILFPSSGGLIKVKLLEQKP